MVPVTIQSFALDESLVAQVAQVAQPRIGTSAVVVSQVARGHHPERANRRERAGLRLSERIRLLARVVDDLALRPARQVEITHENVARIETAHVAIPIGPPRVLPVAPAFD